MTAETQDLSDAATQQMLLGGSQEFDGIQAAPDQSKLAQLIATLRQQQYLQSQPGQTGAGDLSFLANRGAPQAAAVGSSLGNLITNALSSSSQPAPAPQPMPQMMAATGAGPGIALPTGNQPDPNAALTSPLGALAAPQAAQTSAATTPQGAQDSSASVPNGPLPRDQQLAAIRQANALHQQLVASGVDPDMATLTAAKTLLGTGIPGVAQKVNAAQQAVIANQLKMDEAKKDRSQGAAADDEVVNRKVIADRELKKDTWTDTGDTTPYYKTQVNGLGEERRIERAPQPTAASIGAAPINPDNVASTAQAIKDGRIPPLTGRDLTSPFGQAVRAQLANDPTYDYSRGITKAATAKDFASGVSGKALTAGDTAIQHAAETRKLVNDLGNTDSPAYNAAANKFKDVLGLSSAPANLQAGAQLYAGEVEKTISATGGTKDERESLSNSFSNAKTPKQLNDAIDNYQNYLAGKLVALRQKHDSSGLSNFEARVTPATRDVLHNLPAYQAAFPTQGTTPAVTSTGTPSNVQSLLDKYK